MQVEFWHGNCTTFELESNEDVERMFESNLITMGNFYSGQADRLTLACATQSSDSSAHGKLHAQSTDRVILVRLQASVDGSSSSRSS